MFILAMLKIQDIYSKFEIKLLTHNTTFGIEPPGGTASQSFNIIVINSTDIDFESRTKIIIDVSGSHFFY